MSQHHNGMFPSVNTQTKLKKEAVACNMVSEDHIKGMLAKNQNIDYAPWKNKFCPRNAHAPFGDFPEKHMNPKLKGVPICPTWSKTQASTNYGTFPFFF